MEIFKSRVLFILLFLFCCVTMGEASYVKYKDPKQPLNVRINDLLSRMTSLAEKIGQMSQLEWTCVTPEVVKNYFVGSLMSAAGDSPEPKASVESWVNAVNEFQKGALATRLGIPMIFGIDAVHGHNNVYNATIFPHNIGLGATRDPVLVKKIGAATALEARATGIPYVFAPCVAVCRDPRWGRCYESYSEDPKVVQEMTEIISGLQGDVPANNPGVPFVGGKDKVAACAKHFVGDGGTYKGINENNTIIDLHGLLSIHMPPYYRAIIKGVSTIMVSFTSWNGVKMHANHYLLTDFLKNKLHFRGFVISDAGGIDKITSTPRENYTYSIQVGIQAGIDMVVIGCGNYIEFIDGLTHLVEKNIIPMSRINDAVRRILRVKFNVGLFENPFADLGLADQVGRKEHRELAREAVRKSLVLLKNGKRTDTPMLPLPKNAHKILIAGSHAHNLGYQCGGWTIEFEGVSGNNLRVGTTILDAVKSTVAPTTQVVYSKSPDIEYVKQNDFSFAIVAVGEGLYAETGGDSVSLIISSPGPSTIKDVCSMIKCVVILISGRPVVIEPDLHMIDALVAAWLPGTEGLGVADVIFGDYGFSGKLPRTWFRSVDQLPMNFGDLHYDPLFPFGFGLTTEPAKSS